MLLGFLIQLMFGGLNYSLVDPLFNVNRFVKESGKKNYMKLFIAGDCLAIQHCNFLTVCFGRSKQIWQMCFISQRLS